MSVYHPRVKCTTCQQPKRSAVLVGFHATDTKSDDREMISLISPFAFSPTECHTHRALLLPHLARKHRRNNYGETNTKQNNVTTSRGVTTKQTHVRATSRGFAARAMGVRSRREGGRAAGGGGRRRRGRQQQQQQQRAIPISLAPRLRPPSPLTRP